jgi:hypothetical protein
MRGGTKFWAVRTQDRCYLDTHVPFFSKSNAKHLCQILSGIWLAPFFFAETDTHTRLGHEHPHLCLCNTGQDYCSITNLLGTPPLATQQLCVNVLKLIVKAIWQSTKEEETKGPRLQRRTLLASLHKSTIHGLLMTVLLLHHAFRWPAHRPCRFWML